MKNNKLKNIKAMIFDVDGIMTDARIFYHSEGEWRRFFSIRDGHGIIKLQEAGFIVGIITTSNSEDIRKRAERLKITHFYEGKRDKTGAWADFLNKTGLSASQVGYMGDDDMDLPLLEACGWAVTVPDGISEAKKLADFVTHAHGGQGAVREVCELLLNAREK
jgi:3-deoxy-D-manno-octulosonate 8-phosphate phosphatase (KDO 8-P phosphatase)